MPASVLLSDDQRQLVATLTERLDAPSLLWLSGYLAGLAQARSGVAQATPAGVPAAVAVAAPASAASAGRLTIVYGSQTGNAKRQAEALLAQCEGAGLATRLVRADRYATRELKDEQLLYVVISTQGDGEPPDDALAFVEFLNSRRAPKLPDLKFAVLGLGDSSYPSFCGISQQIDERLAALGGQRLLAPGAADVDVETVADPWRAQALSQARDALQAPVATPGAAATATVAATTASAVTRDRPASAMLLLNQPITGRGSDKDIRHLELSLADTGLRYQAGDALGVWPVQDDTLVAQVLETLRLDPAETVTHQGHSRPLGEWLGRHRELTVLTRPFLAAHAERAGDARLTALLAPESRADLASLMATQQVLDVLRTCPAAWGATELVAALRPLAPRLYSIASSPLLYEDEVHLTLANVAYERDGESRWGVASRFLCGLGEGDALPVYVEENERFRLPADGARDILMIGPGTGVAPFRAFVQERQARGDTGRNWLFFGNPHFRSDFLYQTEWQQALRDGGLHRLDLAFSRDQAAKIYVQHRLLERGADVHAWIEGGAHVYVCGDAARMAPDVHQALLQVASQHGGLDEEGARAWLDALASQGRYVRDVY